MNEASKLISYLKAHSMGHESFRDAKCDYFKRFERLDEYLAREVHPHVNVGVNVKERLWLTDHGYGHIETVIDRASDLCFSPEPLVTPYEAYLLLCAIHFHDTGNVFGRSQHEMKVGELMAKIDTAIIGENSEERRIIKDIALVHGGYVGESKDTFTQLKYRVIRGDSKEPRVLLLAAILRLADEISDDHKRTSRFLMENDLIPKGSEVYHAFADRLREVRVIQSEARILFRFELNSKVIKRRFGKLQKTKVLLIDEILERMGTTFREKLYCDRFLKPTINIESIDFEVTLCSDDYMYVYDVLPLYQLRELGYPTRFKNLGQVCNDLSGFNSRSLKNRFQEFGKNKNTRRAKQIEKVAQ